MKNLFYFLLITIISCSKTDSINDQIIGEWKLIEVISYGLEGGNSSEGSIDYSKENIIYNFQSNGKLFVIGETNAAHSVGEYDYFFGEDYLSGSPSENERKILLVKIDNSKWTYNLTNGVMILGKSFVDGPNLVFERK